MYTCDLSTQEAEAGGPRALRPETVSNINIAFIQHLEGRHYFDLETNRIEFLPSTKHGVNSR